MDMSIKFKTKEELADWVEMMRLQNTNGRETPNEMFKLGIESAIEELIEFNLFSIPVVVGQSEQLKCEHKGRRTATELVEYCEDCKKILFHP